MNEGLIRLMARSGCRGFYIGAESGSQRMLDHYHKKITVDQIIKTCELCKKYKITVSMSLIIANPVESFQDKIKTWQMVHYTKPDILYVNIYRGKSSRFGNVQFKEYLKRTIKNINYINGTWQNQSCRK